MKLIVVLLIFLLVGCATVTTTDPTTGQTTTTVQPIDVHTLKTVVATHADLLAAAQYAEKNGYVAVGQVYRAQEATLTAIESQINECNKAIASSIPKPPDLQNVGPILAFEMAREAVGSFSGPSAAVKINCEPITLPTMPVFPNIPKL